MNQLFRRNKRPLPGRGAVRWTKLEVALMIVSVLLIVFPLYASAYIWINPVSVPAAPDARATETPAPGTAIPAPTSVAPTDAATSVAPTDAPTSAATSVAPTDAATSVAPTSAATSVAPTSAATSVAPTSATTSPTAATNPTSDTTIPTADTTSPTATTIPTDAPDQSTLSAELVASTSSAKRNQEFSYAISIYSTSSTASSVSLNDDIDDNLTVIDVTSSSGSCVVIDPVTCSGINVRDGSPASVTIRVRVKADAASGRASNNATVTANGVSASSRTVQVEITADSAASPTVATVGPTSETTQPNATNTPTPTATNTSDATATSTSRPGATKTPKPDATDEPDATATKTPKPTAKPSSGGSNNHHNDNDEDKTEEPVAEPVTGAPVVPPNAALPPTARPGGVVAVPQPTARPATRPAQTARPIVRVTARPSVRPAAIGTPAASAAPTFVATAIPPTNTPVSLTPSPVSIDSGLYFRMASNWGSAFAGDPVYYVIAVRNNRPASGAALNNIVVSSALPPNLEITENPKADRGDVVYQQGSNTVTLKVASLKPGEGVEIGVQTKIKANVPAGNSIVANAAVIYDGLSQPAYSNIVTLQVVSGAPLVQPTQGATPTPTNAITTQNAPAAGANGTPTLTPTGGNAYPAPATAISAATAAATSAPTAAATSAATAAATSAPTSAATAAATSAATAAATSAPTSTPTIGAVAATPSSGSLPDTSSGVPILGLAMLGLTLMTRTIRVHREQNRI